jgi:CDP-diacylglycerol--glycerol-3-phosphate 3-phosphatidyltransferase
VRSLGQSMKLSVGALSRTTLTMPETSETQSIDGISRPAAESREEIFNVPNIITMVRIALVPLLLFMPLMLDKTGSQIMAWFFIAAALTDWVDGWIARSWKMVTRFGKLIDPLADKLLVTTALIMLLAVGRLDLWGAGMVVIIIGREFAVTGLRGLASAEGVIVSASGLGKLKAFSQNVAVIALLFHHKTFGLPAHSIGVVMLAVASLLTLWSGWVYFSAYFGWRQGSENG